MAAVGNLRARSGTRLFPGRAEAVSAVRFYLAELLNGCPVADEVILCASELAANAVIHSDSGQPEGQFAVRAEVCPGQYVRDV
jgi:anti-sigma regulatory factor (Ser/Thr protein kinase)